MRNASEWDFRFRETVNRGLSKRVKQVLGRTEGTDSEWKRELRGLEHQDIVAFANSAEGGVILVGVDEKVDTKGVQKAVIVGCPVGDSERQGILNKAQQCVPPVDVRISIENVAAKPLFRIEIPSGRAKPYCTPNGRYLTRGSGRTNVMFPAELLRLFEQVEAEAFVRRFSEATSDLNGQLTALRARVENAVGRFLGFADSIMKHFSDGLQRAAQEIGDAEAAAQDAALDASNALDMVGELATKVDKMEATLKRIEVKLNSVLKDDTRMTT